MIQIWNRIRHWFKGSLLQQEKMTLTKLDRSTHQLTYNGIVVITIHRIGEEDWKFEPKYGWKNIYKMEEFLSELGKKYIIERK
jgi:hypothetical protein